MNSSTAYVHIPAAQQKKVGDFIKKFREDPTSNAINYESLKGHENPLVRTVRIDPKYRAVVLHPDEGNVYVLMWVDRHDEAMDWAKRRSFEINPRTGALQVFNVEEARKDKSVDAASNEEHGLLDGHSDEVLLSFGVPQNDLFLVGDAHQRIYGQKVALKACGINVQGRASRLRINYRTTEEIRAWAMAMLEGVEIDDLDGEREDETGSQVLAGWAETRSPSLRDPPSRVGIRRAANQGTGRGPSC